MLTPIALIFWLPFAVFVFPLTLHFNVAWWQTALGFYLYHQLWGGLVERLARRRFAQLHRRVLVADAGIETSSTEEVRAPVSRLSGLDDYEDFMTRWFGRYDRLVHHVFHLAFLVFMFYPGWWTKALGVLWILGFTKFVRASTRRQRLHSPVDPVLPATPTACGVGSWERRQTIAAVGEMPHPALEGDDRRPGDPHERVG
ncbi:hypothetical protein [Nannocystis bainbridge]|uniref:Glycosyl-4,4'-diaponeurosporenoate acyltransferase n=1 Tax=Nannocystis bainbridge TaxID=2995303 RepID=A0ABT5DPV6_9BACT|nr:hypothetical protein [Nannocystis bainbridge]MDC0715692.1 hypothetical protein [Nannocystis bainbridge]